MKKRYLFNDNFLTVILEEVVGAEKYKFIVVKKIKGCSCCNLPGQLFDYSFWKNYGSVLLLHNQNKVNEIV